MYIHLKDRKFKTCKKLDCMGGGGTESTEGTEGTPIHQHISSKD